MAQERQWWETERYIQGTGSKMDDLFSLLPNIPSVPFTGRLEPGCRRERDEKE